MFMVFATAVVILMHVYVWKRLLRDTRLPMTARRVLVGVLALLAGAILATIFLPRVTGELAAGWYAWPGFLWLALALYLSLILLILEPVRWVVLRFLGSRTTSSAGSVSAAGVDAANPPSEPAAVSRRVFIARTSAAAAGVTALGMVGYGATNALGAPNVLQVPIQLRRLNPAFNGFRIAVVSDIHLGPLLGRSHTERIVTMINETEPDLVAVVGDLIDGSVEELGHAAEPLRGLESREGTFFVTGNHEYFSGDTDSWITELDRLGVQTLRNENTVIRRRGAAIDLVGVTDVTGAQHSDPPDFERALAGVGTNRPTVLLSHQPVLVDQASVHGVDLQLSGHTHGGQLVPFQLAVEAVQPALAGLSTVRDTQLYVTRGVGFWGPPVRIGAPPDISILTLRA